MFKTVKNRQRSRNDEILITLGELKSAIDAAYHNLNNVTDVDLIDGYIYELKAANMKYQYFLKVCKENGAETRAAS